MKDIAVLVPFFAVWLLGFFFLIKMIDFFTNNEG